MSRALHPMLERLLHAAAAPAQLVRREQATRATFEVFGAALGRVGLQAPDPWQRLLQLPLAEPGADRGALQTLLAQIEQRPATDAAEQADTLLPRAVSPGPQRAAPRRLPAPSREQGPTAAPTPGQGLGNITRAAVNLPAMATAIAGVAGPATNARRKSDPLPDSWLQRATRAGLLDALFTPVQRHADSEADFWGAVSAAPQRALAYHAAAASASSPAHAAAPDAGLARLVQPVLPLLQAALERIQRSSSGGPDRDAGSQSSHRRPSAVAATTGAVASALSRRIGAWGDGLGVPAPQATHDGAPFGQLGQALGSVVGRAMPSIWPAPGQQANGSNELQGVPGVQGVQGVQGLRGLAARAARAAVTNAAGLRLPAGAPARPDETTMSPVQQAAAPDDEQLVEQLARVLKREAERDGIDVSDVLP